jgi:CDP-diacylglycerol--glycerol-3-phosphate 3-phosphatidyltransferase
VNLPNKLTMTRIILSPFFLIFFLIPRSWSHYTALFIFLGASFTDIYDGYLARKTGVTTNFGKFMDPLADKLLTSTAFVAFVAAGYIKSWMVSVIILREFLVTGLRSLAAYRGVVITPSPLARWKTGGQMSVIVIILFFTNLKDTFASISYHPWNQTLVPRVFNGMVFVVMILTVVTGIDYLIKHASSLKGVLR